MYRFLKAYWPTITVVAIIIYATWIPKPLPDETLPTFPHYDKLIHAIMFGGLTGAMLFDYYRSTRSKLTWRVVIAFASGTAAFGVLDETVQGLLMIGRPSEWMDVVADWVGIIVAMFAAPPAIRRLVNRA